MGWGSPWVAAGAGALQGIDHEKMTKDREKLERAKLALEQQLAELHAGTQKEVAQTMAGSREKVAETQGTARVTVADQNNTTRRRGQDLTDSRFWGGTLPMQYDAMNTTAETARRGQDQVDERFWGGSLPMQQQVLDTTDATRRRGQDVTASTATRGQDLAHGDRQAGLGVTREALRTRRALGVMGIEGRQKPNIFGTEGDPKDWADRYDAIYNAVGDASPDPAAGDLPPDALPAAPAPAAVPPVAAPAKGVPVPPRPQAAAGAAPPSGLAVNARVKLRDGRVVTVTKVHPDGTFEYQ